MAALVALNVPCFKVEVCQIRNASCRMNDDIRFECFLAFRCLGSNNKAPLNFLDSVYRKFGSIVYSCSVKVLHKTLDMITIELFDYKDNTVDDSFTSTVSVCI